MAMTVLSIFALISLTPAILLPYRKDPKPDRWFWAMLALAIAGTVVLILTRLSTGWKTDVSTALWFTIFACLILYLPIVTSVSKDSWRLSPLLMPYLFILGVLAIFLSDSSNQPLVNNAHVVLMGTHILVSVATYGLITLAAVAALAASIQSRALKLKKRTTLSKLLPSVTSSEKLVLQLLYTGELVLIAGLITGMASQYLNTDKLLIFDHKTIFAITVFLVIGILLILNHHSGTRGKTSTHLVLLAYILLTLGYPGVKLVTDVILVEQHFHSTL